MSLIPSKHPLEDSPFTTSLSTSFPITLSGGNSAFVNNQVDWKETQEAHIFKADITGLNKEEVKVEVEEGIVLQISGERNMKIEDKNDASHRVECCSGKFMRSFTLPSNAKMDQVKATMDNGVLIVTVPKEGVKKAIENSN